MPVKKLKIEIQGYPCNATFFVKPIYTNSLEARSKLVRTFLAKNSFLFDDVPHLATDFVVEIVENTKGGEIWHLGS